jgi:phosphate starvation-inducible PhoH-like protein
MSRSAPRKAESRAVTSELEVSDARVLLTLCGPRSELLPLLERETGVDASLRGHTILLSGDRDDVALAERFLAEAATLARQGITVEAADIGRAIRTLRSNPEVRLGDMFDESISLGVGRRPIGPRGVAQKAYVESIRAHDLTFGIGPAGTGKTYLAMACAVSALQERKVKRIVLTRPAVEAGEKLGFLPGDLAEKVNPYLRPLYDALNDMMDIDRAQGLISRGQIEVAPLAFMRGRTLNDSFVILDEAQNTTGEQMRMFLTRLGYNSKAVVTGDVTQVDLPEGKSSGLAEAEHLLGSIDGIAFCRFTDIDVVRHPLVQKIVVAYEERDGRWRAAGIPMPRQSSRAMDGREPGEPPRVVVPQVSPPQAGVPPGPRHGSGEVP